MKRYSSILLIILFCNGDLHSQEVSLQVGSKAPEIKVIKWVKGTPLIKIEKGQVYLIEFGASWCIPCAKAIPHLTKIAKQYGSKLKVLSIFVLEPKKNKNDLSYISGVEDYIKKLGDKMGYSAGIDGPDAYMELNWLIAAHKEGVPFAFVIDRNGVIAWIGNTNSPELDEIIHLVTGEGYHLKDAIKRDSIQRSAEGKNVDQSKPLFINGNGGDGSNFLYRSILTKYNDEHSGNLDFIFNWKKHGSHFENFLEFYQGRIQQIGVPLVALYYLAYADTLSTAPPTRQFGSDEFPDTVNYPIMKNSYGKFWYIPVLEVSDSSPFVFQYHPPENLFNYSLSVPFEKGSSKFLQEAMQRDLKTYFGYNVSVEERMMPYWKLISSEKSKTLLAKSQIQGSKIQQIKVNDTLYRYTNAVMMDILERLQINFSFGFASIGIKPREEAPFIDETGISYEFNYNMTLREYQEMRNGNWNATLEFLHRFGLELVKGERLTKVVVILDP